MGRRQIFLFKSNICEQALATSIGFTVQGLYSQHFIFFLTYEWAQEAKVSIDTKTMHLFADGSLSTIFIQV